MAATAPVVVDEIKKEAHSEELKPVKGRIQPTSAKNYNKTATVSPTGALPEEGYLSEDGLEKAGSEIAKKEARTLEALDSLSQFEASFGVPSIAGGNVVSTLVGRNGLCADGGKRVVGLMATEVMVPGTPVMEGLKKKGTTTRSWVLLDFAGDETILDVDKYAIMDRVQIHARDLRILDPLLSYPSAILGREQAIVLNLEVTDRTLYSLNVGLFCSIVDDLIVCWFDEQHIKAIITSEEVICSYFRWISMLFG
ncbi:Magnesium transporter MRS2-2 [Platanthera guangdongensis]|uniref:Magnesium transporter MRS2-2 n=1 Tax=Platanthera guangdongensis TaxID=2320717 RepID=A0ABR2MEW5_9ASPA